MKNLSPHQSTSSQARTLQRAKSTLAVLQNLPQTIAIQDAIHALRGVIATLEGKPPEPSPADAAAARAVATMDLQMGLVEKSPTGVLDAGKVVFTLGGFNTGSAQ